MFSVKYRAGVSSNYSLKDLISVVSFSQLASAHNDCLMRNITTFLIQTLFFFFRTSHFGEVPLRVYRMALPQSGGISSAHIICIHTCTDSEGCLIYQWILGVSDSPPARPASHVTVCSGSRSTFPLQVCSKTGGSWVLYCKSSRCSNKTSRPELILPPQQSVVSCAADSLTSIYSTYLSQLGFIIGVYVQGLVMFALQELRPKNHKSPRIETAVIAATDWTHILAPLG